MAHRAVVGAGRRRHHGGRARAVAAQARLGILAEPVDVDVTASRLASRREIAGEIAARIEAAVRAGHLPAQDTALAATALLGALQNRWSAHWRRTIWKIRAGCATPCKP
jgi:hypothetical protein